MSTYTTATCAAYRVDRRSTDDGIRTGQVASTHLVRSTYIHKQSIVCSYIWSMQIDMLDKRAPPPRTHIAGKYGEKVSIFPYQACKLHHPLVYYALGMGECDGPKFNIHERVNQILKCFLQASGHERNQCVRQCAACGTWEGKGKLFGQSPSREQARVVCM